MNPRTEALDKLDEAKDMLAYLQATADPAISDGMPEDSVRGLSLILQHIHHTIEQASGML